MAVTPERLVVVRGAQMALALVARALLRPGDAVALENLGYLPAWEALRSAGLRLVPIPVDRLGVDVEALAREVTRRRIRAVYVTPHHQYPTTVTLSPGRRLALLELARRHALLVIEDDYDAEFHYDSHPVLPLAASDPGANVVYVGTLSKILAPGLRLGFVAAHEAAVERLTLHRYYLDRQGDLAVEAAVAELIEDGELQRHAWRARRAYRSRRDALVAAIRTELEGILAFDVPAGGMALWGRVARGIDCRRWTERALASGVAIMHGGHFAFSGPGPRAIRIGFARHDERELREAIRRIAAALPSGAGSLRPLNLR
jgi:GntR family transcriptional regulator/MocR family aminotransferase